MKKICRSGLAAIVLTLAFQGAIAQETDTEERSGNIITNLASFIGQTISEIVTGTATLAGDVVREATQINILETGYGKKRKHEPLPDCASEDARNELTAMHGEYLGVIRQYEEELGQELLKSEEMFENSVSENDSRRAANEKKRALERSADVAYKNFDKKVIALNETYDAKRDSILERELKGESCI